MTDFEPNLDHAQITDDVLKIDLGCPQCGYNLRGLPGPRVACPECGLASDLGLLATRLWDKPWHQAPRFTTIVLSSAWVFASAIGFAFYFALFSPFTGTAETILLMLYPATAICIWAALLGLAWRRCGEWAGVGYALLAHLALPSYIGGIIAIISGLFSLATFYGSRPAFSHLVAVLLICLGVGILFLGRIAEKAVAAHCIRLHLKGHIPS